MNVYVIPIFTNYDEYICSIHKFTFSYILDECCVKKPKSNENKSNEMKALLLSVSMYEPVWLSVCLSLCMFLHRSIFLFFSTKSTLLNVYYFPYIWSGVNWRSNFLKVSLWALWKRKYFFFVNSSFLWKNFKEIINDTCQIFPCYLQMQVYNDLQINDCKRQLFLRCKNGF